MPKQNIIKSEYARANKIIIEPVNANILPSKNPIFLPKFCIILEAKYENKAFAITKQATGIVEYLISPIISRPINEPLNIIVAGIENVNICEKNNAKKFVLFEGVSIN